MKLTLLTAIGAAVAQAAPSSTSNCNTITHRANTGTQVLLGMYNSNAGLWGDDTSNFNGWWNSGNMVEIIAKYAQLNPDQAKKMDSDVLSNTFLKAQKYCLTTKNETDDLDKLDQTPTPSVHDGFTREYLDDDGWWAQAWVRAYDVTQNTNYLDAAEDIHSHMRSVWDDKCNGGIYWKTDKGNKNAIPNELFLHVSALLASRVKSKRDFYLDWAKKEYNWFKQTGMINSDNNINDGLDDQCKNNGENVWSYNQGVILAGLVELDKLDKNPEHIDMAKKIADAALKKLGDSNGIIHDSGEPDQWKNGDMPQFKGVFMRDLSVLQQYSPENRYKQAILDNADSIWNNARNGDNQFGLDWSGPLTGITPQTHSSALDTLLSAVEVAGCSGKSGNINNFNVFAHMGSEDAPSFYSPTDGMHNPGWAYGGLNNFANWPTN